MNPRHAAALCFLLIVLSLQLFLSVKRESQTWDEADHIFAGYRTWTRDILRELGQLDQARACYEKALGLAKTIEPEFQIRSIPSIEERLQPTHP